MEINVFLGNAVLYGLPYKLDIKVGEKLTLVVNDASAFTDVFVNNDPVLDWERKGTDVIIDTKKVGASKLWIVNNQAIVRELLINVVDNIQRPAESLNVSFGEPQEK